VLCSRVSAFIFPSAIMVSYCAGANLIQEKQV